MSPHFVPPDSGHLGTRRPPAGRLSLRLVQWPHVTGSPPQSFLREPRVPSLLALVAGSPWSLAVGSVEQLLMRVPRGTPLRGAALTALLLCPPRSEQRHQRCPQGECPFPACPHREWVAVQTPRPPPGPHCRRPVAHVVPRVPSGAAGRAPALEQPSLLAPWLLFLVFTACGQGARCSWGVARLPRLLLQLARGLIRGHLCTAAAARLRPGPGACLTYSPRPPSHPAPACVRLRASRGALPAGEAPPPLSPASSCPSEALCPGISVFGVTDSVSLSPPDSLPRVPFLG